MLINAIRAENLKSRHSNMWVAVLILPLLTAAIGAIIYGINASANLYDGAVWQQLWLQTGLFYGYFFFPILIAICASYLWRLEHTNDNAGFPANHFHCEAGCADKIYSDRTGSFDGVYHYRRKGCVSV